jgi:glycosyltransferase involved in cell wall biosynthesis
LGAFSAVNTEIAGYIHGVDAFALPLDNGIHLNNSSLASIATYGKPVIGTRGPAADGEIVDGENALLCRPKEPEELAHAIERLIDDPGLLRQLSKGSRSLASRNFDWNEAVARTLDALLPPGHELSRNGSELS